MESAAGQWRRIVLYGCTGAGKTTAAREIGRRTGLAVIDEDELIWRPGWEAVSREEQVAVFSALAKQSGWVIDGDGPGGVLFAVADVIILLDYPRWLSFARLLRRSVLRAARRTQVCNGNYESWAKLLGSDSILRWHARTWKKKRLQMRRMAVEDPERVLIFGSPKQLETGIQALRSETVSPMDPSMRWGTSRVGMHPGTGRAPRSATELGP